MLTKTIIKKIDDSYLVIKRQKNIIDNCIEIVDSQNNLSKEELLKELSMTEKEFNELNNLERYYTLGYLQDEELFQEEGEVIDKIEEWLESICDLDFVEVAIEKFVKNKEAVERFLKDTNSGDDVRKVIKKLEEYY